ncbi:MAG: HEAT repeat domain-containing protein, partial [Planctomycetes bacterium]|nr:HEAT repeat domain-containing protein [Planctomycetota bacterium]
MPEGAVAHADGKLTVTIEATPVAVVRGKYGENLGQTMEKVRKEGKAGEDYNYLAAWVDGKAVLDLAGRRFSKGFEGTGRIPDLYNLSKAPKPSDAPFELALGNSEFVPHLLDMVSQASDVSRSWILLCAMREKPRPMGQDAAAKRLAAMGKERREARRVLADLIEGLRDESAYVRTLAAKALGRMGPDARGTAPALARALKDKNKKVREAVADALL